MGIKRKVQLISREKVMRGFNSTSLQFDSRFKIASTLLSAMHAFYILNAPETIQTNSYIFLYLSWEYASCTFEYEFVYLVCELLSYITWSLFRTQVSIWIWFYRYLYRYCDKPYTIFFSSLFNLYFYIFSLTKYSGIFFATLFSFLQYPYFFFFHIFITYLATLIYRIIVFFFGTSFIKVSFFISIKFVSPSFLSSP